MSVTQFAPSVPTKRLAAPILSTDAAFSLNNYLSWSGNALVAADFPPIGRGVFRNTTNTQIEFFTFDPATIAGPITITARGLDYRGGVADGAQTKYNWPAFSTLVELGSNPPAEAEDYVDKTSDQTISGLITFTQTPVGLNPGAVQDASTSVKGIVKMTVAPVSPTSPLAVGDNDTRVPTAGQALAIAGNDVSIALGSGNKLVSQTGSQIGAETYAVTTGAANTYEAVLSPLPTALTAGMALKLKSNFANTGAALLSLTGVNGATVGTFTVTVASPGVFSLTSHGLVAGDIVKFTTTGALPTGLVVGTKYYVIATGLTSSAFEVSATLGGSAINTTGSQSGTHTCVRQTINITKNGTAALVANDILNNQEFSGIYDGTQLQLTSQLGNAGSLGLFKNNQTTYDVSTASGTQNIAHGLGVVPKFIKITATLLGAGATGNLVFSTGAYNGTTNTCLYSGNNGGTALAIAGANATTILTLYVLSGGTTAAVATFDATNIILTWTKGGSPTGTAYLTWEAFA